MALTLYNSHTGQKEPFQPANPEEVRIYNCGPTVYNYNHIGNFRSYMFVDLLRRYLLFRGYRLNHTSNITDVDDKIIENAIARKESLRDFTKPYINAFLEDNQRLKIDAVENRPHATDSIPQMIAMIEQLIEQGHAYNQNGNIYFRLASYPDYGKLSKLDPEELRTAAGGRFDADEYSKEDARDFALWKAKSEPEEPSWPSPWGEGRPGWHLECSAMIRDIYGDGGIDIHIGGIDLLFPHHENEIAQSCCAWPHDNFVRLWLHNEHLLVDGKKMSKSIGNFYLLRDLIERERAEQLIAEKRAPESLLELIGNGRVDTALRYLLLSTHYRTKLNFTFDNLRGAAAAIDRIQSLIDRLLDKCQIRDESTLATRYRELIDNSTKSPLPGQRGDELRSLPGAAGRAAGLYLDALDDDLNIARALAALFDHVRDSNIALEKGELSDDDVEAGLILFYAANELLQTLRFSTTTAEPQLDDSERDFAEKVEALIVERQTARKNRDFTAADQIREQLIAMDVVLQDTGDGVRWSRRS